MNSKGTETKIMCKTLRVATNLKPLAKPIIILTMISALVFWYTSQFMPLMISIGLTIFIAVIFLKLLWKKKVFQKAYDKANLITISPEELREYTKTPYIRTNLPRQLYKVKQWKNLTDDAQYQLIHEYEIILTDHRTRNETIIIFLKKINKENYKKGIAYYKKSMNSVNSATNTKSSQSRKKSPKSENLPPLGLYSDNSQSNRKSSKKSPKSENLPPLGLYSNNSQSNRKSSKKSPKSEERPTLSLFSDNSQSKTKKNKSIDFFGNSSKRIKF